MSGDVSTPGCWKPGVSGNPSGRPKEGPEVREAKELARAKSVEAIRRLVQLMESRDEKVSLAACNSILDRGLGRPSQAMELSGELAVSRLVIKNG
jgi:hypothetical protein